MFSLYLQVGKFPVLVAEEADITKVKEEIYKHNSYFNIAITNPEGLNNAESAEELNKCIDLAKVIKST